MWFRRLVEAVVVKIRVDRNVVRAAWFCFGIMLAYEAVLVLPAAVCNPSGIRDFLVMQNNLSVLDASNYWAAMNSLSPDLRRFAESPCWEHTSSTYITWARIRTWYLLGDLEVAWDLVLRIPEVTWQKASSLPDGYVYFFLRGWQAEHRGDWKEASNWYALAVIYTGTQPDDKPKMAYYRTTALSASTYSEVESRLRKARAYMLSGMDQRAVPILSEVAGGLSDSLTRSRAFYLLGQIATTSGDLVTARSNYERSVTQHSNVFALCRLVSLYAVMGNESASRSSRAQLSNLEPSVLVREPSEVGHDAVIGFWYSDEDISLGPLIEMALLWGTSSTPVGPNWCQVGPDRWINVGLFTNLIPNGSFDMNYTPSPEGIAGFSESLFGEDPLHRALRPVTRRGRPTTSFALINSAADHLTGVVSTGFRVQPGALYLQSALLKASAGGRGFITVDWYGTVSLKQDWFVYAFVTERWEAVARVIKTEKVVSGAQLRLWNGPSEGTILYDDLILIELVCQEDNLCLH